MTGRDGMWSPKPNCFVLQLRRICATVKWSEWSAKTTRRFRRRDLQCSWTSGRVWSNPRKRMWSIRGTWMDQSTSTPSITTSVSNIMATLHLWKGFLVRKITKIHMVEAFWRLVLTCEIHLWAGSNPVGIRWGAQSSPHILAWARDEVGVRRTYHFDHFSFRKIRHRWRLLVLSLMAWMHHLSQLEDPKLFSSFQIFDSGSLTKLSELNRTLMFCKRPKIDEFSCTFTQQTQWKTICLKLTQFWRDLLRCVFWCVSFPSLHPARSCFPNHSVQTFRPVRPNDSKLFSYLSVYKMEEFLFFLSNN